MNGSHHDGVETGGERILRWPVVTIRDERPDDIAAIREVHDRAFGREPEGRLVDALRANGAVLLSSVAVLDGRVVGHVLYSPAIIGMSVHGAALGPVAVLPEHQRQGIGTKLIEVGNLRIKSADWPFIIVLGHPTYYPRFGFRRASDLGIKCEWDVAPDVFMVRVLDEQRMRSVSGVAKYRDEFGVV